jgi:D-sedoheptulose 7-phosphate isomerase
MELVNSGHSAKFFRIQSHFDEHQTLLKTVRETLESNILMIASLIIQSLLRGGTVFWCGNGGSASDSQHLAAELVGRFNLERDPIRSIALTTDTSILTSIANDYEYSEVFSRQVRALSRPQDILIALSTSGNSKNLIRAVTDANSIGLTTIGILGRDGGEIAKCVTHSLVVPSHSTARIQEMHILVGHIICDIVETEMVTNQAQLSAKGGVT